ncbi:MAG: response regulator, partial [Chloroflexales bacterium]|nr:response regulator [Chloroflexales bacterium]
VGRVGYAEVDAAVAALAVRVEWTADDLARPGGRVPFAAVGVELAAWYRAGRTWLITDVERDPRLFVQQAAADYLAWGVRAIMSVPLGTPSQWVAVLYVGAPVARDWTTDEVALVREVGERTWAAVERARAEAALHAAQVRRLAEEQRYAARLRQLNVAALAISAASSVEDILRGTVQQACAVLGARQAGITLVPGGDWARAQTVMVRAEQDPAGLSDAAQLSDVGLAAVVYRDRQPLRLTQAELEAHPAWRESHAAGAPAPRNGVLAVPLCTQDHTCIGVVQLAEKDDGAFTAADEALLRQLVQTTVIALANQHLYAQEQRARVQAEEASRLKDEFLATVSHELRTPLTAVLGYAQLLLRRTHDEAYVARTAAKLVRSAQDQAQLIEDLLDVSRIVSGRLRIDLRPIDMARVIGAALDTVRPAVETKGLQLQIDLRPEASVVIGDAHRVQQVVWNLLANATKFTPPGGRILVRLERLDNVVQLTVSDTGQGISAAFLPHVFDRFRQADSTSQRTHGGLGLGLAIVRHLVELHGGTVAAASPGEGQGATFTVWLPLAGSGTPTLLIRDDAPAMIDGPPALRGLRVLIVDDQPAILELLHELLAACGAVVQLCRTAREALATLRTWRPDVLVSDVAMPGEDGYWLIREVRALAPEDGGATPAVALTAYVRVEDRMRVLAAGFQQYLPKPVDQAELQDVVASLARTTTAD